MFNKKNHLGTFSIIKSIIAKLIWLLIGALFGFALVLFADNRFDFLPHITLHDYHAVETPPSLPSVIEPGTVSPVIPDNENEDNINNILSSKDFLSQISLFDDALTKGYYLTDLAYNGSDFILAKSISDIDVPNYFSISKIERQLPLDDGAFELRTTPRPALHPRMGFILLQKEDLSFSLLNSQGKLLCDLPWGWELISARDSEGNPVFVSSEGYFYFSEEQREFLPSSYDPVLDAHGVYFDYPSYYDMPRENVYRAHGDIPNSWGFKHVDGRQIVSGIYDFAYQFSQGYGVVQNKNGRMSFHNVNGYTRFTDHAFYAPQHNGIESLGFYSFDRGLMRVRELNYNWQGVKTYEREYVITTGNKEFFIPKDYKIESYFDGVFLLSKNGNYGYYNYLGQWICQPVYTYATPFIEGLGVIGYSDGKKGVVDENGNFVVPMLFDEIAQCSGGVMTLYNKNEGWYILNKLKNDTKIDEPVKTDDVISSITTQSNIFSLHVSDTEYNPTYIAEQASYDYTIWVYNNPIAPLETIAHSQAYAPTYIAERAAYDYTMWTYNNPISPFAQLVGLPAFSKSYIAETPSYEYTMWLYNNTISSFYSVVSSTSFKPSYNAEKASYDYTMWLVKYSNSALLQLLERLPFIPSYISEKAAYDYTMWLYSNN